LRDFFTTPGVAMKIVVTVALFLTTLATPAAADPGPTWGPCPDAGFPTPGLECTTIEVPLDYRHPHGEQIQVAVSRLPSTNPAKRHGVLLTNPGGPGGPGLSQPIELTLRGLPAEVREAYDIIGFDPRGIGHSTPVTCALPPELQVDNVPPWARDAADVVRQAEHARDVADRCWHAPTARELPHITTANTARDMDRIRAALGERTISYYGLSYGTYLGAVYASLFPRRTDRVLLDSALGPHGLDITASRRFALGFQLRFPDFAAWLAARDDTYGLGATPAEVTAKYFELAGKLDQTPIGGFDGAAFRLQTFAGLYFEFRFPPLAQLWQAVDQNVSTLAAVDIENVLSAQLTVVCNDNDWPDSVRVYQRNVAVDRVRYPMFGAAGANIWACAFWPDPVEPPVRVRPGAANVLVMENLRDPATPLPGAVELAAALGHRTRLVTVDQGGHGVYLLGTNVCANDISTRFLLTGERPPPGFTCPRQEATS
jgi:pimeloyl-ACP methyl ester carboxylesterase